MLIALLSITTDAFALAPLLQRPTQGMIARTACGVAAPARMAESPPSPPRHRARRGVEREAELIVEARHIHDRSRPW